MVVGTPKYALAKRLNNFALLFCCRRFCGSRNFQGWYNQRRREANDKLQQLHTQALCHMNWREWSLGKQEVEVVDLILRMNDKLVRTGGIITDTIIRYIHV